MRNSEPGPERCRGIIRSPGSWIMRCIDAVWLVSVIAFLFFWGVGPFFPYTFFEFFFHRGIQGVRVSTHCVMACPSMSLPSTCPTQLGRAILGAKLFVLIFLFVRFLGVHRESTCLPHLPMARSSHPWRSMQPL